MPNYENRDFHENPMTPAEAREAYMRLGELIRTELGADRLGALYVLRFAAGQMERDLEAMLGPREN